MMNSPIAAIRRLPITPLMILGCILAIGMSLQLTNGLYDHSALLDLTVGIACAFIGLLFVRNQSSSFWSPVMQVAALLALAIFAWLLAHAPPLQYSRDKDIKADFTQFALPVLILCTGCCAVAPHKYAAWSAVPLAVGFFIIGAWLLRTSPAPFIDVFEVTRDSCQAAARGINPYSITFPNIYAHSPDQGLALYPLDMMVGGRIQFGYQYTPLSFMIAFAGYLSGDYRLGNLGAIAIAAILLSFTGRSRVASLSAALLLLMPRTYFVVEQGWSEPTVVLSLALAVCCAVRHRRLLPYAVGIMLVSKQHMLLVAPLVLLLVPRPWSASRVGVFAAKAFAAGAIVSLPLILWNPHAFWHSAIEVQLKNPFRTDSLNYAAWWFKQYHQQAPSLLSFASAALAAGFCIWRFPRNAGGFAFATGVVYLAFFALAKQAFCNYYFMISAALCCALAVWQMPEFAPAAPNVQQPGISAV